MQILVFTRFTFHNVINKTEKLAFSQMHVKFFVWKATADVT